MEKCYHHGLLTYQICTTSCDGFNTNCRLYLDTKEARENACELNETLKRRLDIDCGRLESLSEQGELKCH